MAATDARPVARKNQAFRIYFGLRQGDGTPIINWSTPSGFISKDGAAFANTTSTPTEITPLNTGAGYLDLTATEMNCDGLVLKIATSNASMIPLLLTLYPEQSGDYRCDVVMVDGAPVELTTAADVADAVWDEDTSTHRTAGSAGMALITASGNLISGDWSTHSAANVYTAFGTGSNLTAVGLSSTSINAVADQVWDEVLSGHATTGSAGRALALASGSFTPAQIWAYGTRTITGLGTDTINSTALATSAVDEIVDQVWNEVLSTHTTTGSAGRALALASGTLVSLTATSRNAVADQVWDEVLSTHTTTGSAGRALALASGTLVALTTTSRNAVADQVWDEILSGHTTTGSTARALAAASGGLTAALVWGYATRDLSGTINSFDELDTALDSAHGAGSWATATGFAVAGEPLTSTEVTQAVWNATMSSYDTPGTTGHALVVSSGNLIGSASGPDANTIADAVWNEQLGGHLTVDSAGWALGLSASGVVPANVVQVSGEPVVTVTANDMADAVWDEQVSAHTTTGSAGDALITASGNLISGDWSTHSAADVWTAGSRSLSGTIGDFDALDTALDSAHGAGSWATATGFAVAGEPLTSVEVTQAVWNATMSSYDTPGTTGHALVTASGNLISGDWSVTGEPLTQAEIRSAVGLSSANLDTQLGTIDTNVDTLITGVNVTQINGSAATVYTDADIADAVWDEDSSTHRSAGSTGMALITASGNLISGDWYTGSPDASGDIAQAVWEYATRTLSGTINSFDELDTALDSAHGAGSWATATGFSTHNAADVWTSAARTLTHLGPAAVSGDVADAIWDEQLGTHLTVGSAGELLGTAGSGIVDANILQVNGIAVVDDGIVDANIVQVSGENVSLIDFATSVSMSGGATAEEVWTYGTRTLTNLGPASTSGDVTNAIWNATTRTLSGTISDFDALDTALDSAHGAGSWATATGFSTHNAADVAAIVGASGMIAQATWEYATRTLSTQDWSTHSAADVWTSANRSLTHLGGAAVSGDVWDIVYDATDQSMTDFDVAKVSDTDTANTIWGTSIHSVLFSPTSAAGTIGILASGLVEQKVWTYATRELSGTINSFDELDTALDSAHGAGSWATATGFSTHNAADVAAIVGGSGDIANRVDYVLGSTHGTGSWLTGAGAASGDVAQAVWEYATRTLSTQDWSTHSAADVWTASGRSLSSAISNFDDLTASGVNLVAVNGVDVTTYTEAEIVDAVWDEPVGDHQTAGTTGEALVASGVVTPADVWAYASRTLSGTISDFDALDTALDSAHGAGSWEDTLQASGDIAQAVWEYATRSLTQGVAITNSGMIAEAVWDVNTTGHTATGTFGQQTKTDIDAILVDTGTTLDTKINTIDTNVDTLITGVNVTQINGVAATVYTDADIADAVWDETVGDHVAAGSTGQALITASGNLIGTTTVQTSGIAYAVWEEQLWKHAGSGTTGQALITASGNLIGGGSGTIDTTGLATTTQLEYWALMILNTCGGGPVG